jgi:ribosomal protein S18 acetylase RimI-like enzyme
MAGIPISVRTARKADVRELARAMGRAFFDDPPVVWMLPDERSRERRAAGAFRTILRSHAMQYGGVDVASHDVASHDVASHDVASDEAAIAGGAIWLPPGHWAPTVGEQLRSLPGYARALGRELGRASELAAAMASHHPREEHWYLYAIGVDPARQGQGVASALLRSRLARCDADAMPAYLESTKSSNVPLYEHFGFEVTGTLNPPRGAPPLTAMWRYPAG